MLKYSCRRKTSDDHYSKTLMYDCYNLRKLKVIQLFHVFIHGQQSFDFVYLESSHSSVVETEETLGTDLVEVACDFLAVTI